MLQPYVPPPPAFAGEGRMIEANSARQAAHQAGKGRGPGRPPAQVEDSRLIQALLAGQKIRPVVGAEQ